MKISVQQKRNLAIATLIAVVIGVYFLKHYLMLIAFAAIVAFMFNPFYQRMLRKNQNKSRAASLTLLLSILVLLIPLGLVIGLTVTQVLNLLNSVDTSSLNTDASTFLNDTITAINSAFSKIGIDYQLSLNSVQDSLKSALEAISSSLLNSLGGVVGSISAFITSSIIYIYVFISLLVNQDKLVGIFKNLNPLGEDINGLYQHRAEAMTKAMVRGQFIIAFLQGLIDSIMLYAVGFESLFFFFLVILTLLSIIPLGGGVIVFPIGIVLMLTGNIWGGALLILGHILIVGNIDNILRPRLVPHEARLDPALTLLSVFSGLAFFGFIGIILGPVLMIIIVTTIETYLKVYKNQHSPIAVPKPSKKSLLDKVQFWNS